MDSSYLTYLGGNVTNIRKLGRYLMAIAFGLLISVPAQAVTKEQAVKAGFVYNLTKFTVWPENVFEHDKFNLCIVGKEKLGGGLEALYGKIVGEKTIVLRRELEDEHLHICHMVFIAKDSPFKIRRTLKRFIDLPVVTVSDSPDFISHGGMVGLVRDEKRVGFEVNLLVVKAAGLRMHSQLLKLAKKVRGLK